MTVFMTNMLLLLFLVFLLVLVIRTRRLFAVVVLAGAYTLVSAAMFVNLDAVDVAFTEAAVGAGISTVLMLGTLALTSRAEKVSHKPNLIPLFAVIVTGAAQVYGTLDMPSFGAPEAPVHTHLGPAYLHDIPHDIHVPNAVTAILASYRGYDTLGETAVVFAAGIGVLMLISGLRRRRHREDQDDDTQKEVS